MGRGGKSVRRKVLPLLTALTGLLAEPGMTPTWARMSDTERQGMIGRVDTAVSEIGLFGAQTNDSGDLGWPRPNTRVTSRHLTSVAVEFQ